MEEKFSVPGEWFEGIEVCLGTRWQGWAFYFFLVVIVTIFGLAGIWSVWALTIRSSRDAQLRWSPLNSGVRGNHRIKGAKLCPFVPNAHYSGHPLAKPWGTKL
jgi:uncharacterized membrane protein YhaH (DUF805 family)